MDCYTDYYLNAKVYLIHFFTNIRHNRNDFIQNILALDKFRIIFTSVSKNSKNQKNNE